MITLWLFNIAMENCPFIDDYPIKTSIYKGFSMAMLNNQMVIVNVDPLGQSFHMSVSNGSSDRAATQAIGAVMRPA